MDLMVKQHAIVRVYCYEEDSSFAFNTNLGEAEW